MTEYRRTGIKQLHLLLSMDRDLVQPILNFKHDFGKYPTGYTLHRLIKKSYDWLKIPKAYVNIMEEIIRRDAYYSVGHNYVYTEHYQSLDEEEVGQFIESFKRSDLPSVRRDRKIERKRRGKNETT
jgi:hypothetical protein